MEPFTPFNLKKALAGEPFNIYGNKYGNKYFAIKIVDDILIYYVLNNYNKIIATGFNSITFLENESKAVMCEESEQKRFINGIEVPEPVSLDNLRDGMRYWYVDLCDLNNVDCDDFYKSSAVDKKIISQKLVFETKEGAKAMVEALLNYKVEIK